MGRAGPGKRTIGTSHGAVSRSVNEIASMRPECQREEGNPSRGGHHLVKIRLLWPDQEI
jgi:hypothetical protein